jgi:signal transduction histidine kinase
MTVSPPLTLRTPPSGAAHHGPPALTAGRRVLRFVVICGAFWVLMIGLYWGLLLVQTSGYMTAFAALKSGVRLSLVPSAFGVIIWWLTGIVRWPERQPLPFILTHVGVALIFATTTAWWLTLPLRAGVRPGVDIDMIMRSIVPWQLASGLFLYGLIAGVSYAVRGSWGARDLRVATERAERLQAQAELAALRAHINPHFLFNTLHSVTTLLRSDPARAEAALERLSDLFRYALRLDRERVELVSLEDEWAFTSSYLWLEEMRMGGRLRIDASLSDDALACAVPPFTLQPLVENAVRHGLSPKVEGGTVRVRATESDGTLVLDVQDDGIGADPSALANGAGIGVRAVRQRLEARHATRARAEVAGAPGAGLRVTLTFPAEPAP